MQKYQSLDQSRTIDHTLKFNLIGNLYIGISGIFDI